MSTNDAAIAQPEQRLHDYLCKRFSKGASGTDEILSVLLPLFRQVLAVHLRGQVAPFVGLNEIRVTSDAGWFPEASALKPRSNPAALREIDVVDSRALEITGRSDIRENDAGAIKVTNLQIGKRGEKISRPIFLPGFISWEHEVEHHDQLTDIFSLGMILASAATGLDLADEEELEQFVEQRANLFALNARLHPVVGKAIVRMTDPQRRQRAQDLAALIDTLTNYRMQTLVPDLEFSRIRGFKEAGYTERSKLIQQRLRDRLFDTSRRNRLIYFRPTMQMLNLTLGSVPLMLDYKNISADSLCTWQGTFAKIVSNGETVQLGKYLRFEDAPYLPGLLDQIKNQEARDRTEYGFSQLRLVVAFLRWHNLKDVKEERITSPLVLLPVSVNKKKGVRDSFTLTPLSTEAEINPILRYQFRQVYGLQLPEIIDLAQTDLNTFFDVLQKQIHASEPGITLRMIDKPQIKLVHERARLRAEMFRRRTRLTGLGARTHCNIDYSYARENFQPLGMQLFLKRVMPSPMPLQSIAGEGPKPRFPNMVGPADAGGGVIRERDAYVLQEDTTANPYVWDFDLCSLTLGNFNYRKMSLVQDYTSLLEGDFNNRAFDSVFSLHPRKPAFEELLPLNPAESFQIVASDPTQMTAVTRARSGSSYIIQGPPGTGKSQTITNLIADYSARGKRVLFVCEKRAAIDVVFHRLKQRGLEKLCCLIHDSQADKKSFIQDLKATYEGYLSAPDGLKSLADSREQLAKQLHFDLDVLQRFAAAMEHVETRDGLSLRAIYLRLIELADSIPQVSDADAEQLPDYSVWPKFGQSVHTLSRILGESGGDAVFAKNALRHLAHAAILAERPIETITSAMDSVAEPLNELKRVLIESTAPADALKNLEEVAALVRYAARVKPLIDCGQIQLLNAQDPGVGKLKDAFNQRRTLIERKSAALKKTEHWRDKIPASDLRAVTDAARKYEGSFLRFLSPGFWKLRGILHARYDFAAHVAAPTWVSVLKDLAAEYAASEALDSEHLRERDVYKTDDVETLLANIEALHAGGSAMRAGQRALRQRLLSGEAGADVIIKLIGAGPLVKEIELLLAPVLANYSKCDLAQINADLSGIRDALPILPEILSVLTDLLSAPPPLYAALVGREWSPKQLEAGILSAALLRAYRRDRSLLRLNGRMLAQSAERTKQNYAEWMVLNSKVILAKAHAGFIERANLSNIPAAQLNADQKEFKKIYTKGRRELEHEFGKVMRFRSIRDLSDDETGAVVADLKPIWLMSPLSVSDTLPLAGARFDVVIFDEASQIPLEEAIPALYRAAQIIVVGDEMQLPPTDFFGSGSREDEEDSVVPDVDLDGIGFELNADSFLTQSAANLPSTMLCWHYRSRSESLISFSNAAFYSRKLLTVPDVDGDVAKQPIEAVNPEAGDNHFAHVLDRPVSFHYMPNGIYADRQNPTEAAYIARLVRGILNSKTGESIGIVAFSEAQQSEIESALNALAADDSAFDEVLQAEFAREEDEQFCGLFVKNLENVQGDERDIIIMSVCYGYDANKKMLMNFGPINKNGGEKRLNVVFSRARKHMALVASIHSTAITNDYNEGANCLKRYLAYAEALSAGQYDVARRVLGTFSSERSVTGKVSECDGLSNTIAAALRSRGYEADLAVGQSDFRCDVAVRRKGEPCYALGILIDKSGPRHLSSILEQYILRPAVLNGFGWQIVRITTKDWHHEREVVLTALTRILSKEPA